MSELLNEFTLSSDLILFLTVLSIGTFLISLTLLPWLVLALPADYFKNRDRKPMHWGHTSALVRLVVLALKNILAAFMIVAGILMLILPGQGILTILAGLVLLDFPGKFHFLRSIAQREHVLKSLNWIRRKGDRKPFVT